MGEEIDGCRNSRRGDSVFLPSTSPLQVSRFSIVAQRPVLLPCDLVQEVVHTRGTPSRFDLSLRAKAPIRKSQGYLRHSAASLTRMWNDFQFSIWDFGFPILYGVPSTKFQVPSTKYACASNLHFSFVIYHLSLMQHGLFAPTNSHIFQQPAHSSHSRLKHVRQRAR